MKKKKAKRKAKKSSKTYLGPDRRKERRHFPRLPICARVRWGEVRENEKFYFTRDISNGGLFLMTDHPPPLYERLNIELSIQYMQSPLHLQAEVVRYESERGRATGCGVKLLQENPRLNEILESLRLS